MIPLIIRGMSCLAQVKRIGLRLAAHSVPVLTVTAVKGRSLMNVALLKNLLGSLTHWPIAQRLGHFRHSLIILSYTSGSLALWILSTVRANDIYITPSYKSINDTCFQLSSPIFSLLICK